MLPLTADCPKPLLPVGPWTLIDHQVAALTTAGVERIVLSTGYRHADFHDLVVRLRDSGVELITTVEESPLGTGGGLREALRALPGSAEVIVLNGDLLSGHDLSAQVERLRDAPAEIIGVVHAREVADARPYGSVVTDDEGRITAFVEKSPSPPSSTVNAGTYVVRHELLRDIATSGPASLEREVFPALVTRRALVAHRDDAYFLDVGSPAALVTANRDLLMEPWPGAAATPRGPALVLPGALVHPSAVLTSGTVVHPRAVIGAGVHLESAVIMAGARVDERSRVVRSVIGHDAHVGSGELVTDDALGPAETRPAEAR